jgi:hypothetical protein
VPKSSGLLVAFLSLVVPFLIPQRAGCQTKPKPPQSVFEDDRIRVEIPAGWSFQPATEHVGGDTSFELPIGALLTKGKYRLYLLSHEEQASGIEGGRFSEGVQYISPWIDMSESPWLPCHSEIQGSEAVTNSKLTRQDLYFARRMRARRRSRTAATPVSKLRYGTGPTLPKHATAKTRLVLVAAFSLPIGTSRESSLNPAL